jgi:hypothetical protein
MLHKKIYEYINKLIKRSDAWGNQRPRTPRDDDEADWIFKNAYEAGMSRAFDDVADELQEILETPNETTKKEMEAIRNRVDLREVTLEEIENLWKREVTLEDLKTNGHSEEEDDK